MTTNQAFHDDDPYDTSTPEGIRRRDLAQSQRRMPAGYRHAMADDPEVVRWCDKAAVSLTRKEPFQSLLIHGDTGVGKTHQAYGAIRYLVSRVPVEWLGATAADLFAKLRPSEGRDSEGEYSRWASVPLLMVDDIGSAKVTEWTEELTYRLVNHRSAWLLPTIFTTNLPPRSRSGPSVESMCGARVFSRLAESKVVHLQGKDRRRQGPAEDTP